MKNLRLMQIAGASEVEILRAEIEAAFEIIGSLPVDTHDMGVHFWCKPEDYCVSGDEGNE